MTVPRVQQIAAIALLVACVLIFLGGLVFPVLSGIAARKSLVAKAEHQMASIMARRRDIDGLEAHRQELERAASKGLGLIVARSEPDAEQKFQQVCRTLMSLHKVELGSLRKVSAAREGEFIAMRLEATMRISAERLAGFIAAVEFGEPIIFLERVRLARTSSVREGDAGNIAISATLRAYAAFEEQGKPLP